MTSQFEKMMDSIEDIASPAIMDEFRDTVIAPNVASILDNIVNTVDEDMIDEIEDFIGAISQEQEAFVADLIAANPTLKAKVQAAVSSVKRATGKAAGKAVSTASDHNLGVGLALFAVSGLIFTVLLVVPSETMERAMQFTTIAALVYSMYMLHEKT
ncbi:hypothetical protein R4P64_32730 [Rhodococcus sp. IEGM 1366]|uniref:hypothetical protein n=2 Tax=Rhodococcus TaxID=1827 RepID=UPI0029539F6E|nr:hypothetical protein [Rhodococcus sp. IEGM 1366]MCE4265245.1 hypothetical protein [Rhodococcus globerulus]MDV8071283.1 hypothetical protein [Rhodococcus sp. IEGM 1366]